MLKRLAILIVLLATQISTCHSSGEAKQNGKNSYQPPAQSVTVCDPYKPVKEQPPACQIPDENADQRVKLTDIPPISIVKTPKDWLDHVFDWGPWVFNFLLVIVGGIAGYFAWQTLGAIHRQADLMKEQLDTARQKERPRLRIEMEELDLTLTQSPDMILIRSKIKNYGGSVAFVAGNLYGCWIGKTDESESRKYDGLPMILPEALFPDEKFYDPGMILTDENGVVDFTLWSSSDPRIESVRKGEASIYLKGFIMYENIFDETWILSFKRKFTVHLYDGGYSVGRWSREGDAENYERLKIPSKPQNPN